MAFITRSIIIHLIVGSMAILVIGQNTTKSTKDKTTPASTLNPCTTLCAIKKGNSPLCLQCMQKYRSPYPQLCWRCMNTPQKKHSLTLCNTDFFLKTFCNPSIKLTGSTAIPVIGQNMTKSTKDKTTPASTIKPCTTRREYQLSYQQLCWRCMNTQQKKNSLTLCSTDLFLKTFCKSSKNLGSVKLIYGHSKGSSSNLCRYCLDKAQKNNNTLILCNAPDFLKRCKSSKNQGSIKLVHKVIPK